MTHGNPFALAFLIIAAICFLGASFQNFFWPASPAPYRWGGLVPLGLLFWVLAILVPIL
jgi:hypothetical protein